MPAQAHAVAAENPALYRPSARLERTQSASAYVPALRQGPTIRRLLGPSAWELWGRLQTRAFRSEERLVTGTLRELGGVRASERTTSWALRRLVDAGVIAKVKTRTGLCIQVLAFDRDQWGVGEYSPYLSPQTLQWMAKKKPRGRPKKPKEPMRAPQPQAVRRPPPDPRPTAPADVEQAVLALPFIPPDPRKHVALAPRTPRPPQLNPEDRGSAHREILIELYVTAMRCYWPRTSLAREVKWLRTRIGQKLLTGAAETFLKHRCPPAMWVKHECERVSDTRKSPLRPEVLFDPERVDTWCEHAAEEQVDMLRPQVDRSPQNEVFREGRTMLDQLQRNVIYEVLRLPDPLDEEAARAVVEAIFPGGWQHVYHAADAKMRELQAELDHRAQGGTYLWRPHGKA